MQLATMLPVLVVALLGWSCGHASAKVSSYNLTESVVLPLKAVNQHGGKCEEPGSCVPANVTVKANQIAYFCGFDATYKVRYHWKSQRNLQTFLARERHLTKCDIHNFDSCKIMKATKCSKVMNCTVGRYGTVFGGSMCFAIVNNRDKSSWISFTVHSEEDKSLAGGRAGCILLTIVIAGLVFEPLIRHFLPNIKLGKR